MNFKKLLKNDDNKEKYLLKNEKLKEIFQQFSFDKNYYKKNNIIDENIKNKLMFLFFI